MLYPTPINGATLPDKTLCLTFDDGPGPYTLALASYLWSEGIAATFFVVGGFAEQHQEVVSSLAALGHHIGNHTYSHADMTIAVTNRSLDIVADVERTSALLKGVTGGTMLFRAPYGSWSPAVADELNDGLGDVDRYVGPIDWDIDGRDWEYWHLDLSVEACADRYVQLIEAAGRGIVLLHDWVADLESDNKTYEMVKILIPRLKALGYTFANGVLS